jgi:hypothetical protein
LAAKVERHMRIGRFLANLAAAGLFCAVQAPCGAAADDSSGERAAISKLEARSLPPEAVTKDVLDQLSRILHLQSYPSDGPPPKLPLSDLWFRTTPYATELPGLCAYQQITVDFRPTEPGIFDAKTKTVPYRVEEKTLYRFVGESSPAPSDGLQLNDILKANGRCAKLDPEKDFLLNAADEEIALEAIQIVDEISERVSRKPVSFELDCSEYSGPCERDIAKASSSKIEYVEKCDSTKFKDGSARCWDIYFQTDGLDLELKVYAETQATGWKLFRIVPHMLVTTADERAD